MACLDLMRQGNHIRAFLLTVDVIQPQQRKTSTGNQITQHTAWSDTWQLVFITDDAQPFHMCTCFEQMIKQPCIDHGKLIYDKQICLDGIIFIFAKGIGIEIPLQKGMDGGRRCAGELRKPLGCPAGWGGTDNGGIGIQQMKQLHHCPYHCCLASARTAGHNLYRMVKNGKNRFFLDSIIFDTEVILDRLQIGFYSMRICGVDIFQREMIEKIGDAGFSFILGDGIDMAIRIDQFMACHCRIQVFGIVCVKPFCTLCKCLFKIITVDIAVTAAYTQIHRQCNQQCFQTSVIILCKAKIGCDLIRCGKAKAVAFLRCLIGIIFQYLQCFFAICLVEADDAAGANAIDIQET